MMLFIFCATLIILMIIINIGGIVLNSWLVTLIVVIPLLFVRKQEYPYALCFTLPFFYGLPQTKIAVAFIVLYFIIFLGKYGKNQKLRIQKDNHNENTFRGQEELVGLSKKSFRLVICTELILITMECVTVFLFKKDINIKNCIGYLSTIMLILMFLQTDTKYDYFRAISMFCAAICLVDILIVLRTYILNGGILNGLDGIQRIGRTVEKGSTECFLSMNANVLAIFSGTAFCGLCVLRHSNYQKHWIQIVEMSILLVCGVLTFCRAYLLTLPIAMFAFAMTIKVRRRTTFLTVIFRGMLCAACVLLLIFTDNPVGKYIIQRMTGEDFLGGNGRVETFQRYLTTFFGDIRLILCGSGVMESNTTYQIYFSAHNAEIQMLTSYGLPLAIWMGYMFLRPLLRLRGVKRYCWIPMLFAFLTYQTIQFILPTLQMIPYVIGVLCLKGGQDIDNP